MKRAVCLKLLVVFLFGTTTGSFAVPAVTLYYGGNAQVELIGSTGVRVLIDVHDPSLLSSPATEADILLTSHTHPDHYNKEFVASFKGPQLLTEVGNLVLDGVSIEGIAARHNPSHGTNFIYIVVMDGLRIAHFGDLGQRSFTEEQLTVLGKIDIAVMQLDNSYSQMNAINKTGFKLMTQVGPRLIIPTHNSSEAAEYAQTLWPCLYSDRKLLKFSRENLPRDTHLLFLGYSAQRYAEITNALEWSD